MTSKKESEKEHVFEDILEKIGSLGPAQALLILCSFLTDVSVCFSFLYFVFESANPDYTCVLVNRNGSEIGNVTVNGCPTAEYDCVNVTYSTEFTSITSEWNFICKDRYMSKLTASIYFGGVLVGSMLCSTSDYFGRKRVLLFVWATMGVFQASLGLAQSWTAYIIIRFITGIFAGTTCGLSCMLSMEYIATRWRRLVLALTGWGLGYTILALVAYLIREWRYLTLFYGAFPITCVIIFGYFLPESARWHIQRGDYDDALRNLSWIAKLNGRPAPSIEMVKEVGEQTNKAASLRKAGHKTYTVADMFRNKKYCLMTCTQMFAWFSVSIVHYGISSELSGLSGSIYLNIGISGIINAFVRLSTLFALEGLGRRYSLLLYSALPVTMCYVVMITHFTGSTMSFHVRTAMTVASVAIWGGTWNTLTIYVLETYPTLLRSQALALVLTMTRIGGIVAPQISLVGTVDTAIPFIVYGTFGLIMVVSMFLVMPETRGTPLTENIPDGKSPFTSVPDERPESQRMVNAVV